MSIRQLQVANDSVQDRLLLRIASDSNEEIRIFITRRFLREIWPHLAGLLGRQLASATGGQTATGPAGESASFAQPFRDDSPSYPLGANPLLASEATFEKAGDGTTRLILREARERSFTLHLNDELLQALCAMLRAASEQAKWDLPLDYDTPAPTGKIPGKSLLH